MSWRKLFKPWILVRGKEYFECGQVAELKGIGSVVTAEVSGSRVYNVKIHKTGGRVTRMSCECPHAAGGENCKHMAAVLMERMGVSKAEVIAWWEQHRNDDEDYHPLLRLYEEENLPKAIELVQEKRKWEKNTNWQITDYTNTLLRLLEKSENQAEYEKELQHLVLELKCREKEYVSRLKAITPPEQWLAVRKILLADATRPAERMQLYHFEGMYSELFAELRRCPYLGNFQIYGEDLRKWDHERTLKLYKEILKMEMDRACDRKQYRHVAAHLEKLKAYPNGQEEAKVLAAYWHVYHQNRPAMKDELKKRDTRGNDKKLTGFQACQLLRISR